jgi:hypothetical protein
VSAPRFLLYPESEHEAARANPYIKDFIAWLECEQIEAAKMILHFVRLRDFERAFFLQAKADALADVINQFWRRDQPLPPLEIEDDDHPNMPMSARKKPDARTE